ncbi:MAG: YqgE/AlgH family protein [Hyphomicrobiaceae bacterium]
MSAKTKPAKRAKDSYLEGQLLLAMPMMTDKRFRRAVIYMCRHSDEGAMGIIVNQQAPSVTFRSLLQQLDLLDSDAEERYDELEARAVHIGGPVSAERGFVLHSDDYIVENSTLRMPDGVCLTASVDILRAMAEGTGPVASLLALGYSGWAPGQLESEIQANGWLHCAADHDLIFSRDIDQTYVRALSKLGIDPTFLVSSAGHA